MFRKLLLIITLILSSSIMYGQGVIVQQSNPTTSTLTKGTYIADSFLRTGVGSVTGGVPSWWNLANTFNGALRISTADSQLYWYYFGWKKASGGGGGGSGTVTSITAGMGLLVAPPGTNPITTSGTLIPDTTFVSTKVNVLAQINGKVNYTDTASMLAPYLRKGDTTSLSNRINLKQNLVTLTTTGTSGAATFNQSTGALNIPNYATSTDSAIFATNYRVDTAKANLRTSINTKVAYADTAAMLLPYLRKGDTTAMLANYVTGAINGLTKTGKNIGLGGTLAGATTITTSGANTLALAGLQSGTASDSVVVSDPTTGELRRRAFPASGGAGWALTGNTGLSNTANWIGNNDDISFNIKVNNIFSGEIGMSAYVRTHLGYSAGLAAKNALSFYTCYFGGYAGFANTGNGTTGIGAECFDNAGTVTNSLALGRKAATGLNSGDNNTAVGYFTGFTNNSGSHQLNIMNVIWGQGCNGIFTSPTTPAGRLSIGTNTPDATAILYIAGRLKVNDIVTNSASPGITLGAGAGAGASFSISGSNNNYQISITTAGTPAANDVVFTATYSGVMAGTGNSFPVFSAADPDASSITGGTQAVYMSGTTTTNVMTSGPLGLTSGVTYIWNVTSLPK